MDEARKRWVPLFFGRPDKPVDEMTDEELLEWCGHVWDHMHAAWLAGEKDEQQDGAE